MPLKEIGAILEYVDIRSHYELANALDQEAEIEKNKK